MFDIQMYPQFIAAILLFQLIPGAGTLAIINATARDGIGAGLAAVGGTLLGDSVWMIGAALGLAAIMNAHPTLFAVLQYFGVGYLLWLAWGLLRAQEEPTSESEPQSASSSSPSCTHTPVCEQKSAPKHARIYARQAALVSLTNPKTMLFFVAFFPLFLRPEASAHTLVMMMLHVTVICALYQAALVYIGHWVARQFAGVAHAQVWAKRLAGLALVGFAYKLWVK